MDKKRNSIENFFDEKKNFVIVGENLFKCKDCNVKLTYNLSQGFKNFHTHNGSKRHQNNIDAKKRQEGMTVEKIREELVQWMVSMNIPFTWLANKIFTNYLEKISGTTFASRTTSRNLPLDMYTHEKAKMIIEIRENPFYIMVDETPDVKGRKIINVLIGILNEKKYVKPFGSNLFFLTNIKHNKLRI